MGSDKGSMPRIRLLYPFNNENKTHSEEWPSHTHTFRLPSASGSLFFVQVPLMKPKGRLPKGLSVGQSLQKVSDAVEMKEHYACTLSMAYAVKVLENGQIVFLRQC